MSRSRWTFQHRQYIGGTGFGDRSSDLEEDSLYLYHDIAIVFVVVRVLRDRDLANVLGAIVDSNTFAGNGTGISHRALCGW